MKQKIIRVYRKIINWIEINLAWVYCFVYRIFRKKLRVHYAILTDPILTTDVSTLVWKTKYCYKLSIENGAAIPATHKYFPVTIVKGAKQIRVVFYGIRRHKEVFVPIRNQVIKIEIPTAVKIFTPSFLSFEESISKISFTTQEKNSRKNFDSLTSERKILVPEIKISFPQFINETKTTTS